MMEVLCAPAGLAAWEHPRQGVGDIAGAGFSQALFDMALPFPVKELCRKGHDCAWLERRWQAARELGRQFRQAEVRLPLGYAPHFGYAAADWPEVSVYRSLIERSIRLGQEAGCRYLVVRLWLAQLPRQELWARNRAFYLSLANLARKYGVVILLENQARSVHGHLVRGVLSEAEEAVSLVDELNEAAGETRFGFCLNMGASGPCGMNVQELVQTLDGRLQAVIICDSDSGEERQLLPFTGAGRLVCETDWLSVIRGLRAIAFDGWLVLGMRDTAAAFPPLLRPQLLALARSVAEYILWQVEMEKALARYPRRVLFGAGNMCRNYMRCYGEQYPPLFTCDNNPALWGKEVGGLAVKNPEELRRLPEDCAIFICNIYYREIEAQLREMGLKNPVAYFNDECLPHFYAGRLPEGEA